jgi:thiol-disulfide isomerase/thioredoxin
MSKSQRNRQASARERIAQQQAAAKRAETRRRVFLAGGAVLVVVAIVVVLVVVKLNSGSAPAPSAAGSSGSNTVGGAVLPASVNKNVTTVPASALDSVGTGSVLSFSAHPIPAITGTELTSAGKPEMLYIGAEFCPFCAAMRWSMAVALSKFGTLSPLHGIFSSGSDTFPNTATLTFYKSSYTSKYLTFTPVENENRTHGTLQNVTAQQNQLWGKYSPQGQRGFPFIDFGNKYMLNGPIYDAGVLKGLTWQQISADLHDPSSPVAQAALGAANFITAAICKMTSGQPGSVCTAKGVTAAAAHLG